MNEKEAKKLLNKANQQRLFGEYEQALAYLHQLNTAFPEEIKYLGLLASTYYGAGEKDVALEYCNSILQLDSSSKEVYELQAMIAYDDGEAGQAEELYKKALEKDVHFVECRIKLIELYIEKNKFEEAEAECKFIFKDENIDLENYDVKKRRDLDWFLITSFSLWTAQIELRKYDDAVNTILQYKKFFDPTVKDAYYFAKEDDILFKLYYLLGNTEKIVEYENLWLHHYKVVESKIPSMEKDANQGHILTMNPENYNIDENGYLY